MLAGLAGCLVGGAICARLFAPKREVVEHATDSFWQEEVLNQLVADNGTLGSVSDLPAATVREMKELELYDLFASHDRMDVGECCTYAASACGGSRAIMDGFLFDPLVAVSMGLTGAIVFGAIGLVSGTDETTTIAPVTLLVILLGVPPVGVFTFWLASAVAKHMTHAIPTALLGIPGDTMATPLLQQATSLRNLGVPHIALRKMISGAIVAALSSVPLAVLFALLLAPFGSIITKAAPWIFAVAAVAIANFSPGRWASVAALVPFVLVIVALQGLEGSRGTHALIPRCGGAQIRRPCHVSESPGPNTAICLPCTARARAPASPT